MLWYRCNAPDLFLWIFCRGFKAWKRKTCRRCRTLWRCRVRLATTYGHNLRPQHAASSCHNPRPRHAASSCHNSPTQESARIYYRDRVSIANGDLPLRLAAPRCGYSLDVEVWDAAGRHPHELSVDTLLWVWRCGVQLGQRPLKIARGTDNGILP